MSAPLQTALVLLLLLQVKHLLADYFLQTGRMLASRGQLWHLGRLQHVLLHALLSAGAFLLLGTPLVFTILLCGAELVAHYLIDFLKGRHSEMTSYGPNDAGYWRAFGIDQLAHQLTYLAMIWAWAHYTL